MQFVQGPVRTGLYRSSRKVKRTARSGKFVQFVQFAQQISFSLFCSQITMQSDWEPRPLDPDEALYDFTKGVARGTSLLEGTCAVDTPVTVYEYMMRPIMECMDICLRAKGHADLVPLLPRYILFRLGLGMLQPRRIDDLWDRDSMYYNPYMEYLFPDRGAFYKLQRFADPDVDALIELCTEQWQNGWVLGDIVCGDESIVPHKGLFLFRQFIPRKPHTTGVKLYLLCDAQDRYIWHVYLYRGAMPRDNPPPPTTYAGHYTPTEIVQLWHDVAPSNRVLVADTYFGSHGTARSLAAQSRPFLMLIPKSADLVEQGGKGLHPGKVNTVVHKEDGYALSIFKSPKVGKKAARAVPLVTNCHHGPHVWRKRRYRLPGIVANYRTFAPGVDVCNQLCLQHREERRFPNWWKALNGMLLRMASTNAFTSCKALKLCAPGETMHNWQWRLMRYIFPARTIEVQAKHLPIRAKRGTCVCCRGGTSMYKCQACGVSLHVDCFAKYHQ